jgi:hypothetical protein
MPEEIRVDEGAGRQGSRAVNYPGNARSARPAEQPAEKEKVERVVTGEVVRRKRSPFAKLTHGFLAEDSGSVTEFILQEVLLPAARTMIYDIFTQGLERKLFGESRPKSPAQRGYTNYSTRSTSTGTGTRHIPASPASNVTSLSRHQRATQDFADIIIENRAEAEEVLDRMRDLINEYQVCTVADFLDLVGLTGEFTDDKWGWFDLRSASIRMVRGGYMFFLPKTQPIA